MQVKKQQLELYMEQQTGSILVKEYIKAAHCHPSNLIYMQSTSWETPGWMKHKLDSRLLEEIFNTLRYTDDTTFMAEKWRRTKEPFDESEREWKIGLKLNIQKTKIMAYGPVTSWQIHMETVGLFLGAPKSLQMVTAAMKLKDAYSLEGKLWPT